MFQIKNGYKSYHKIPVLENINLVFEDGLIHGLVGINGSGKTLILKALAGYLKLDAGLVYQDQTLIRSKHNYAENAGILIENPEFISHLSLLENLQIIRELCPNQQEIDLKAWINLYHLEKFTATPYRHLSLGTKKKMALIQAFMHQPQALILDEPMNALDEESVAITKEIILQNKQRGGITILTSHISDDIHDLCDTVHVVSEGKVVQ